MRNFINVKEEEVLAKDAVTKSIETSNRYSFISTTEVIDYLQLNGFYVHSYKESRANSEGTRGFQKHLVTLRHKNFDGAVNGVIPQLLLWNSHNGKSSLRLMFGLYRVVCANGLIVGETLYNCRYRHVNLSLEEVKRGALHLIEKSFESIKLIKSMQNTPITAEVFDKFTTKAVGLYNIKDDYAKEEIRRQLYRPIRTEDREQNVWCLLNVVQESMMRKSFTGKTDDNNRVRVRRIRGLERSVKVNKALWSFASELSHVA